jgi:hypothetical protein
MAKGKNGKDVKKLKAEKRDRDHTVSSTTLAPDPRGLGPCSEELLISFNLITWFISRLRNTLDYIPENLDSNLILAGSVFSARQE